MSSQQDSEIDGMFNILIRRLDAAELYQRPGRLHRIEIYITKNKEVLNPCEGRRKRNASLVTGDHLPSHDEICGDKILRKVISFLKVLV